MSLFVELFASYVKDKPFIYPNKILDNDFRSDIHHLVCIFFVAAPSGSSWTVSGQRRLLALQVARPRVGSFLDRSGQCMARPL